MLGCGHTRSMNLEPDEVPRKQYKWAKAEDLFIYYFILLPLIYANPNNKEQNKNKT